MGNYTDLWKGDLLYYQLFQVGLIIMLVLFAFVPVGYAIMSFLLYLIGFNYYLSWRNGKKKEKHEGERHIDSHTVREADYREDKIYSFKKYVPLELQKQTPFKIEDTPEYKEAYYIEITEMQRQAAELPMLPAAELLKIEKIGLGDIDPEEEPDPVKTKKIKLNNKPDEDQNGKK